MVEGRRAGAGGGERVRGGEERLEEGLVVGAADEVIEDGVVERGWVHFGLARRRRHALGPPRVQDMERLARVLRHVVHLKPAPAALNLSSHAAAQRHSSLGSFVVCLQPTCLLGKARVLLHRSAQEVGV